MNDYLWRNLILLIPSFIAMIIGIVRVFPKTKGIYFRMGTLGMACLFAGYLSSFATYLTSESSNGIIDVSILGSIGFSLFLLTQNADSISSMMYDKKNLKGNKIYLALTVPTLIIVVFAVLAIKNFSSNYNEKSGYSIVALCIMGFGALLNAVTSFYTVCYSMSPDEDLGMINCLRPYNIIISILLILLIPERFVRHMTVTTAIGFAAMLAYYILLAACMIAVIPLMERGRSKFLTSL